MRPFALALAVSAVAAAQQTPRYTERVDVASVVVDVRVIDEFGKPIVGLSASDFFVTVGGKPVRVESSIFAGEETMHPASPASLRAHSASAAVDAPGQLIVLLFQKSLVHDRARGLIRMVEQSRSLVRDLASSDRVAILTFDNSLRIWSDFTDDRAALDRILAHRLLHESPPASVPEGAPSALGALSGRAREISTIERAFESIANTLRPLPGSKAIAFIGYGMGRTAFGVRQDAGSAHAAFGSPAQDLADRGDMNNEYKRAWRALTAARVSVFSLDISNADTHTFATGMQIIAADTGGFYASSLDFPERPMRLVSGALNGHYVLFVEPPAKTADRTIDVRVRSSRRAYVYSTSSYRSSEQ